MRTLLLLLLLALPLSVAASSHDEEEDYYEYADFKVLFSEPITLCNPARFVGEAWCPSERKVMIQLPGYAIPGIPYVRGCKIWTRFGHPEWWDGVPVVRDRFRVLYGSGATFARGQIELLVGDLAERDSTVCVRVPIYLLGH